MGTVPLPIPWADFHRAGHPPAWLEGQPDHCPLCSSALFSPCRTWRYSLLRQLNTLEGKGVVTFIGLNPSTADELVNDPTVSRCMRYARDWGFARLRMMNLYAFRSTDPKGLWEVEDPVGPDNDLALSLAVEGSDMVVAAWGAHARQERLSAVRELLSGVSLYALGVTKAGQPRHPLYMRADAQPFVYKVRS